jgi:2,3-bisphosphoglycerate-independent phosphoglycerate mutase
LHLLGLVSDGGVHGHIEHLKYLLRSAKEFGITETFIHFFGDGRDTAPRSAHGYLSNLLEFSKSLDYGIVATITGRYYAMDRDKRWERIQVAYEAIVQGKGEVTSDPLAKIEERYSQDETDEFLKPIIADERGVVQDGDTLIFFNFRSDRMREINQAMGIAPLPFQTDVVPKDIEIFTMTQYKGDFPFDAIFPPQTMDNVLGEWLGKQDVPQSHIAETEKYAHVTFFFNGGTEASYPKEDRELIASPKVATYDLLPQMSAIEVAKKVYWLLI